MAIYGQRCSIWQGNIRPLTALLKGAGWTVDHKRIQRIMAEMGLQRSVKRLHHQQPARLSALA